MTFWLGKQKLLKNNPYNQTQSITFCNVYFSKKVHAVYNGVWGKLSPRSWGIFENFCVKSNLTDRLTFLAHPVCSD